MRSSITPPDVNDFMKARADALAREVAILAQTGAEPAPISEAECATIREQATARRKLEAKFTRRIHRKAPPLQPPSTLTGPSAGFMKPLNYLPREMPTRYPVFHDLQQGVVPQGPIAPWKAPMSASLSPCSSVDTHLASPSFSSSSLPRRVPGRVAPKGERASTAAPPKRRREEEGADASAANLLLSLSPRPSPLQSPPGTMGDAGLELVDAVSLLRTPDLYGLTPRQFTPSSFFASSAPARPHVAAELWTRRG